MKILKRVLIALAIIIAIPLVVALFVNNDYTIEREVVINKPKPDVFNYIKLLKNQPYYSKWAMEDPNAKMTYTGTDGTPGFTAAWESDNKHVGKGEQTITKITDGERMDMDLHFIKPMEGKGSAFISTEALSPNQTKVKWGMNGRMHYPLNFMLVVINMDKMLGGELAIGLTNLKTVLEK